MTEPLSGLSVGRSGSLNGVNGIQTLWWDNNTVVVFKINSLDKENDTYIYTLMCYSTIKIKTTKFCYWNTMDKSGWQNVLCKVSLIQKKRMPHALTAVEVNTVHLLEERRASKDRKGDRTWEHCKLGNRHQNTESSTFLQHSKKTIV